MFFYLHPPHSFGTFKEPLFMGTIHKNKKKQYDFFQKFEATILISILFREKKIKHKK